MPLSYVRSLRRHSEWRKPVTSHNRITVLYDVTPCCLVNGYQHVGRTYCVHFQGPCILKMEAECFSKSLITIYQTTYAAAHPRRPNRWFTHLAPCRCEPRISLPSVIWRYEPPLLSLTAASHSVQRFLLFLFTRINYTLFKNILCHGWVVCVDTLSSKQIR